MMTKLRLPWYCDFFSNPVIYIPILKQYRWTECPAISLAINLPIAHFSMLSAACTMCRGMVCFSKPTQNNCGWWISERSVVIRFSYWEHQVQLQEPSMWLLPVMTMLQQYFMQLYINSFQPFVLEQAHVRTLWELYPAGILEQHCSALNHSQWILLHLLTDKNNKLVEL